jgi:hypothetical protein
MELDGPSAARPGRHVPLLPLKVHFAVVDITTAGSFPVRGRVQRRSGYRTLNIPSRFAVAPDVRPVGGTRVHKQELGPGRRIIVMNHDPGTCARTALEGARR